jgi:acetyltransferase-like isoleucine patch superfamily enzyme
MNRVLHMMARTLPGSTSVRPWLHRMRGVSIGRNVFIGDDAYLENEYPECIELQDNVEIGLRSVIIAHLRGPGKVLIKKDAWLGAACVVAAASERVLTIGEGAVVGAGSIITSDVPDHAFVRPVPVQHVAIAQVPLANSTYMEFFRGLRPLRRKPDPPASPKTGT